MIRNATDGELYSVRLAGMENGIGQQGGRTSGIHSIVEMN